jgi:hypothetical protein
MIVVRHAWLQKHPSPAAASGEFHWYPREGDRELRAELVERVRGIEPPAVLWELAPGRVVWARSFAATAPIDGRRYVGLVVTIAESVIGRGTERACDLLRSIDVPDAAPWSASAPEDLHHASISEYPPASELEDAAADLVAIARGLLTGGSIRVSDPTSRDLALLSAAVERGVPETGTPRRGAWVVDPTTATTAATPVTVVTPGEITPTTIEGAVRAFAASAEGPGLARGPNRFGGAAAAEDPLPGAAAVEGTSNRVGGTDRVAELLAGAARAPTSSEARAWRVLCDLAETRGESPDVVAAALGIDPLTDEERDAIARAPTHASGAAIAPSGAATDASLTARLHAWGRGRFDLCPTAGSLLDRLADAVALSVVAELASGRDPRRPLAEARWYSLLPADRRASLLDNLMARAASLRSLVETPHA